MRLNTAVADFSRLMGKLNLAMQFSGAAVQALKRSVERLNRQMKFSNHPVQRMNSEKKQKGEKRMNFTKVVVIGVLAFVLLGLYLYTMYLEVNVAMECSETAANVVGEALKTCRNNIDQGGFSMIFTTVGGMIAAVAVGILAVNPPEQGLPTEGLTSAKLDKAGVSQKLARSVPIIIIFIWIACGVLAIIIGFKYSGSPPLTEMAKAWIGTAVAGVGAFLGINPPANR